MPRTPIHRLVPIHLLAVAVLVAPAGATDADSPVADALARADAAVARIIEVPDDRRTFDNTVGAIDDIVGQIELDTNMTQFMAYVSTDADERAAGQQAEEDVSNWLIELGKNEALYRAVRSFADRSPMLDAEQQRLLAHTLRDYRRAGMALTADEREKLKAVQKEITTLSIEFEANIRNDESRVPLLREELRGLPDDYFRQFEDRNRVGDVFLVGMSYPEFLPVMDYCDDEATRKKVWIAYKRRGGRANVDVLEQIIAKRAEAARLLGYQHPADYETEVRMAKNAETVMAFYERLRPLVRRKAERDYQEFVAAKRSHTGNPNAVLYPWDFSYYQNRLKKEKYAVDSQRVREYFPLDRVTEGLFSITQSLYGLEYRDVTRAAASRGRPLWHPDVTLYEVWDRESNTMLGEFYLDLHPRDNKYGHAAQWGLRQHKSWSNGMVTKPLAALVCNFTKPTPEKPSLLSHDEVETYFHEFGHCLHTILSESSYWQFSGTAVERDFVEAPSQMFENWIWDAAVLKTFARHYRTGAPFPDELLEGMIKARHLGSGMMAERQFYYGLYDMTLHTDPTGEVDTTRVAMDLWDPDGENVELYDPVPETHFQAAFGHLTGYQAGYYGYQWSLVYASDMFQRFKELGMLDPEAGRYYRDRILARGGTVDGLDLVREYLGREPDMNAYLEHLGLENDQ
ncbi:MAG: M3 family metallopeptidase [Planctomycetota bacterium]|jgi:thimet oligopeptidase